MQVQLSIETASSIEELVRRGAYPDAAAVIDSAVRRLTESDADYLAELRRQVLAGIASLDANGGTELSTELTGEIKASGRALLQKSRQSTP
jgi:putative addiction module CopG family antidote